MPSRANWVRLRPNWSRTAEPPAPSGSPLLGPTVLEAARFLAGLAGHHLDDLGAHAGHVGAEVVQDLGGDALALAHEAEEHVLGADVGVSQLESLAKGELEDLLRPRGEGGRSRRRVGVGPDGLFDLLADHVEGDPEGVERLRGDAFALSDQAEQDVLGADESVVEVACLFLGEDEDPAGSIGEALKQWSSFYFVAKKCTGRILRS